MQAKGVTVGISSGGGGGDDPSSVSSCTAAQVQALYQSVINKYHIKWFDFDIENSPEASGQIDKRSQALAALKAANPGLTISYSLPLGTYGLNSNSSGNSHGGDDGINLLTSAQKYGLTLDVIDGLAQDFGNVGVDVGSETTQGTAALESQVQSLGINSTIGICTLIGTSDPFGPNNSEKRILYPCRCQVSTELRQRQQLCHPAVILGTASGQWKLPR